MCSQKNTLLTSKHFLRLWTCLFLLEDLIFLRVHDFQCFYNQPKMDIWSTAVFGPSSLALYSISRGRCCWVHSICMLSLLSSLSLFGFGGWMSLDMANPEAGDNIETGHWRLANVFLWGSLWLFSCVQTISVPGTCTGPAHYLLLYTWGNCTNKLYWRIKLQNFIIIFHVSV